MAGIEPQWVKNFSTAHLMDMRAHCIWFLDVILCGRDGHLGTRARMNLAAVNAELARRVPTPAVTAPPTDEVRQFVAEIRILKQKADAVLLSNARTETKLAKLAVYGEMALSLLPTAARLLENPPASSPPPADLPVQVDEGRLAFWP